MSPSSPRCPSLYREISEALRAAYGLEIEAHELPQVLRFGSWIGGDRDGNPFVTPEVTRDAIRLARGHLLLYYQRQLDDIIDLLTTSAQQRPVSDALLAAPAGLRGAGAHAGGAGFRRAI